MKTAIYARNTSSSLGNEGIKNQIDTYRAYAINRGDTIVGEYVVRR